MPLFFKSRRPQPPSAEVAARPAAPTGAILRRSSGLKDFLWLIPEAERPALLELGGAAQSTISFFSERGFRIIVANLLESWEQFCRDQRERAAREGAEPLGVDALASRFLEAELRFPAGSFHGALAWDVFDCLEEAMVQRLVARLYDVMVEGGVLLALFHTEVPATFWRYRIRDVETIELLPVATHRPVQRIFQNREILNLFGRFRSCRTYIGRDQLREALVVR